VWFTGTPQEVIFVLGIPSNHHVLAQWWRNRGRNKVAVVIVDAADWILSLVVVNNAADVNNAGN
jgi:hypothetical protein